MLRAAIVRQTAPARHILSEEPVSSEKFSGRTLSGIVKADVLRNRQAVSPKLVRHHGNIAVVAVLAPRSPKLCRSYAAAL